MDGNTLDVPQFANFAAAVLKALPRNMTPEDARRWEENGDKLTATLASALSPLATPAPREKQSKPKPKFHTAVDGTITFSVTSDGTTGIEWISRLKAAGHKVSDYAEQLLRSSDFVPTSGTTTKIVVLPGKFWKDSDRLTRNVRAKAVDRKLEKPNAEVACLIRLMFTNEEIRAMGLRWLVVVHEPIVVVDGDPSLLTVLADVSESWLGAYWDDPDHQWYSQRGFLFAVPQV